MCVYPQSNSTIVNLRELHRDLVFKAALDEAKSTIKGYSDVAGRYGNSQHEVVLEIATVTQHDIYSMGGHSTPFELLVDEAARLAYVPSATPEQREALLLKAEHVRSEGGPNWLSTEVTQRVVTNVKPHAEWLREIKREQNRQRPVSAVL